MKLNHNMLLKKWSTLLVSGAMVFLFSLGYAGNVAAADATPNLTASENASFLNQILRGGKRSNFDAMGTGAIGCELDPCTGSIADYVVDGVFHCPVGCCVAAFCGTLCGPGEGGCNWVAT